MKITAIMITLLTLASCGKDESSQPVINPPLPSDVVNESVLNKFESVDGQGLHGINQLDYSQVTLGVPTQDTNCNGSYGNVGLVNGVDRGFSLMTGSTESGTLQFGHLAYKDATPAALATTCKAVSKEAYTYVMNGDVLTLCMVNYNFCADYKVVK